MSRQDHHEKLASLIDHLHVAMLTTVEDDGELRSRPMGSQGVGDDGGLVFYTHRSSPKVVEASSHPVNISFADPAKSTYVSISGHARVSTDRAEIERYWKPQLKAWFDGGVDDPDIALLHVTIARAEYWDAPSGPLIAIAEFARAATGVTPVPTGDHAKIG